MIKLSYLSHQSCEDFLYQAHGLSHLKFYRDKPIIKQCTTVFRKGKINTLFAPQIWRCMPSVNADCRHPPIGKARHTVDTLILPKEIISCKKSFRAYRGFVQALQTLNPILIT